MIWKATPALDSITFKKSRSYVAHNTVNIPDHMVIAMSEDVPEVTIKFNFADTEERIKAEIEAVIRCMNEQGKFASKSWVCDKLNFKERKGDMYFTALKRDGIILELNAIRRGRRIGTFYRINTKAMKRKMQIAHATMRRNLCGHFKESINSPKGSLGETREENQTILNSSGKDEEEFGSEHRISLRHQRFLRNHEDGSPGDGTEHTFYTAKGCFDRLTNPDNNPREYAMMEKLISVSNDAMLIPAAARSAARRIDSLVITPESVDAICKIIIEKRLAYNLIDIIRNFEEILNEHTSTIRKEEIDVISDQINEMTVGSSEKYINNTIHLIYKHYSKFLKLSKNHEYLSYNSICNEITGQPSLPIFGTLIILSLMPNFDKDLLPSILTKFKERFYKELSADLAVYEFMKKFKNFNFINWREVEKYRFKTVGALRCMLFVNKLSNRKLDRFYNQLNFLDRLYATGSEQHAGFIDVDYSPGSENISGSFKSDPWSVCYS